MPKEAINKTHKFNMTPKTMLQKLYANKKP
jgi:hypothetical protein